jgi:hypothetical protein
MDRERLCWHAEFTVPKLLKKAGVSIYVAC